MEQNNWYTSRWAIFIFHLLTWVFTIFLPYLIRPILEQQPPNRRFEDSARFEMERHGPGSIPYHPNERLALIGNRPPGSFFTHPRWY